MRLLMVLLIACSIPVFASCGSGVTVETDSPVDIPEQVEVGGVTVETPDIKAGGVTVDPDEDKITTQ
jgi:hypothetical protein